MAGSAQTVDARLEALLDADYPRFSADEMSRRRRALIELAAANEVDRLLLYGANRSGTAVGWLTGWQVTREAAVVVAPGEGDVMFVQFRNHVPLARELATSSTEVRWGGASTVKAAAAEVVRRGGHNQRVGVIGQLPYPLDHAFAAEVGEMVSLTDRYNSLRLVKSAEELDWMRLGARLSDEGMEALAQGLHSGLSERGAVDLMERAYVPKGGTTHIHYIGVTSMRGPSRSVPAQYPSNRRITAGDAVMVELSAAFWSYPGQVLRTFTVEEPPTSLYRELHGVAEAALDGVLSVIRAGATPAELQAASSVIEDAGYTTCDDLVHGFGGGYLPPVIVSRSQAGGMLPEEPLRSGMTVVVQPNVITVDGRAGVQTGELVHVTAEGFEPLHRFPRGLQVVGI